MPEVLHNVVADTLAAPMNATDLVASPANPNNWPGAGNYRVLIDGELILVTLNDFTQFHVARGIEGTAPTSHAIGSQIKLVPTAGGLYQWGNELISTITNYSAPRSSITLSYNGTAPGLNTFVTILDYSGNTLLARTHAGITESGPEPGLYLKNQPYIPNNLELLVRWDEGNPAVYTRQMVRWPGGAGSVWRSGVGAPSNALGIDNDFYFQVDTGDIWERLAGLYTILANLFSPSSASVPSTGAHTQGERYWNSLPVANGTMGWVCVSSGTPGTWKTFGPIAP